MPMPRSFGSSQVTFLPLMKIWPARDVEQAGDAVEQGGLAAAGRAEQDEELALGNVEIERLQHLDRCRNSATHRAREHWSSNHPFTAPAAMPRTKSFPETK